ncbi:hypothetical protein M5K25_009725 [Dendrobium thyrsiflorum]|uniref:NB-ARC domain-containing protein n=1 Tax=Dendrobium thyrsiflorum TaxID=117978 RepID=A0ABD0V6H3_DENTH
MVKSKKFLLVLDDIWNDDKVQYKNKWENVLAPPASGKLRGKILVTTRMESVALMISNVMKKKNEMLRLEGLNDAECLLLLLRYAFVNVETFNAHHMLLPTTRKIVKKLSGSPLAARVIDGILNSHLDESHWIRVLNYDIGSQNDILSVLKLSYIFLPKVLQNCLSFCSIFPQDYGFDKDDLVRMWIALGFIQPSNIRVNTKPNTLRRLSNSAKRHFLKPDRHIHKVLIEWAWRLPLKSLSFSQKALIAYVPVETNKLKRKWWYDAPAILCYSPSSPPFTLPAVAKSFGRIYFSCHSYRFSPPPPQQSNSFLSVSPYGFVKLLSGAVNSCSVYTGEQYHSAIMKLGFFSNVFVTAVLLDLYCKGCNFNSAQQLFEICLSEMSLLGTL